MDVRKIPATVVTGFLGTGKTTLIQNLLRGANGKRIALIINEFGDLGVDGELLKACGNSACTEDDIIELNNGCICCTVADDFVPTMEKLLAQENLPDHIVIETSGLALPQPLVNAFNWPEIREQVTVDGVVTVVDSRAVADGRFADDEERVNALREADKELDHESPLEELFEDQLNCADMIVLNKADLVDDDVLDRIAAEMGARIPRSVKIVKSSHGSIPAGVLLGLDAATQTDIANRKSHHEAFHAEYGDDAEHEHDHDAFESFVVDCPAVQIRDNLIEGLKQIIEEHDILRLKGFVALQGKPMRLVVQAVGNRVDHYFDREWYADETPRSWFVVIGLEGLAQSAIATRIKQLSG